MSKLTHLDEQGRARMVDVSAKDVTRRRALAKAVLLTNAETRSKILDGTLPKGDVLAVARTAGIMAAKRTSDLIPLCHPLPLSSVEVSFVPIGDDRLQIEVEVSVVAKTGAEMEALTAAAVAGLTVYDMCKAVDRSMVLGDVCLLEKSGGRSGDYRRDED
jgi:cyclic pyranopterin phosphate synthase